MALLGPFPVPDELRSPFVGRKGLSSFSEIRTIEQATTAVRSAVQAYRRLIKLDLEAPRPSEFFETLDEIISLSQKLHTKLSGLSPPERDIIRRPGLAFKRARPTEHARALLERRSGIIDPASGQHKTMRDNLPHIAEEQHLMVPGHDGAMVFLLRQTEAFFRALRPELYWDITDGQTLGLDQGGNNNIIRRQHLPPQWQCVTATWNIFERSPHLGDTVSYKTAVVPRGSRIKLRKFALAIHRAATGNDESDTDIFANELKAVTRIHLEIQRCQDRHREVEATVFSYLPPGSFGARRIDRWPWFETPPIDYSSVPADILQEYEQLKQRLHLLIMRLAVPPLREYRQAKKPRHSSPAPRKSKRQRI